MTPIARWGASIANVPSVGVVLFGGKTNTTLGFFSDTWIWNGTTWTQSNASGPSARAFAPMSYDGAHAALTCGVGPNMSLSDTWTFNGTTWTLQSTTPYSAPTTLQGGSMAYQSADGYALLFGGTVAYQRHYVLDSWAWVSGAWQYLLVANWPNARNYASLASNSLDSVLFGGNNFDGPLSDVWKFDGTNWTQQITSPGVSSPTARFGASLVYDSVNSKFVLFGGVDKNGYMSETWTYVIGSNTWTKISPATSPPARAHASMAFDSTNGNTVLYGGLGYDRSFSDTWVFDGSLLTWTKKA